MQIYTTIQNEMIDAICHKIYGSESGYVEKLLEANPNLADIPDPLPIGTKINLPDIEIDNTQKVIALWD